MPAASYHNRPSKKHGNFGIGSLKIFNFLKSDFSCLPLEKTRKVGCLKIPYFSESDLSYLALGKTRKAGCEKVRGKNLQYPRLRPGSLEVQNYMVGSVGVNWVPWGKMGTAIYHVLAFLEPRGTHLPSQTLISLRTNIQKVSCVRQISDSKSKT